MPRLDKMFSLEITPDQFLRNCSSTELVEIDLLIQSPFYQMRMHGSYAPAADNKKRLNIQPIKIETT